MHNRLLELPTNHLLDKIGAGNHKPGSGSAAALNGILSCKLLLTVINLTVDPKRSKTYSSCKDEFIEIQNKISNEINPKLEELFQEDSFQFDKAIKKRKERDKEINQSVKNQLDNQSNIELKKSTELPIEIANLCLELAEFSLTVFDKGFKSARGDSGVALSSSLSAVTGCLSIISLNLQSFPKSIWTDKIIIKRKELRDRFESLSKENIRIMDTLDKEAEVKNNFHYEFIEIRKLYYGKTNITNKEIEILARRIQNALWKYQDLIWFKSKPTNVLGVLKPEKVIKLLKFAFYKVDSLGVNDFNEEIAGIINQEDNTIQISNKYPLEVVNYTTAHELGHSLLHKDLILHRDIPLDGSHTQLERPSIERQADKFAAYFLMPEKSIKELFSRFFLTNNFKLTEESSFMLANCSVSELKKTIKTRRDLSRSLAKSEFYNYTPFQSLSKIFNVSIEAMAIRLEELDLV